MSFGTRADSTNAQYDSKWSYFSWWCRQKKIDPLEASVPVIADFLLSLFEKGSRERKPLAVTTIRGYRSSLSTVFKTKDRDVGHHPVLSQLIKAFERQRPKTLRLLPQWNLALVLDMLRRPPFEPLQEASMQFLSWKTAFLLTLASGKRRSEMVYIDYRRVTKSLDNLQYSLLPVPGFVPKVRETAEGHEFFNPIVILSLKPYVSSAEVEELLLCPYRTLEIYLDRSKALRENRVQLFIPFDLVDRSKAMTANGFSSWIRSTIKMAYDHVDPEVASLHSARPHELRAISTSLNAAVNFDMESVLRAGAWKNPTTFTSYYLRDCTDLIGDLHYLGPVQSAGSIVNCKRLSVRRS